MFSCMQNNLLYPYPRIAFVGSSVGLSVGLSVGSSVGSLAGPHKSTAKDEVEAQRASQLEVRAQRAPKLLVSYIL